MCVFAVECVRASARVCVCVLVAIVDWRCERGTKYGNCFPFRPGPRFSDTRGGGVTTFEETV